MVKLIFQLYALATLFQILNFGGIKIRNPLCCIVIAEIFPEPAVKTPSESVLLHLLPDFPE